MEKLQKSIILHEENFFSSSLDVIYFYNIIIIIIIIFLFLIPRAMLHIVLASQLLLYFARKSRWLDSGELFCICSMVFMQTWNGLEIF